MVISQTGFRAYDSSGDFSMTIKPRLEIIQLLRALAVLFVVVSHTAHELAAMLQGKVASFNEKLFPGDFGVDLFFVISGFIMVYTCWDIFGRPGAAFDFIRRRLIRIVPLYWLATTLMITVVLVFPDKIHTATRDWSQWLASYLFFPYARETDGLIRPVLGLGWSLQYEMYFYLLFAIGLLIQRKRAMIFIPLALVGIFILARVLTGVSQTSGTLPQFLAHGIALEFGAGALLGYAYMLGARLSKRMGASLAVVGLVLLMVAPGFNDNVDRLRLLHYGIPAILFLAAAVHTRGMDNVSVSMPILAIGEGSYAIYLIHPFVIGALSLIFRRLEFLENTSALNVVATYSAAVAIASVLAGIAATRFVDQPINDWLKKIWPGRPRPALR